MDKEKKLWSGEKFSSSFSYLRQVPNYLLVIVFQCFNCYVILSQLCFQVNWNPYKDMNPAIVPEYCIAADNICYSRTWLISFNIKEVYVPDRFARQFGRDQVRLHGVPMWARRTWSKWKDWRVEYAREIEEFHQLVGCRFTPSAETNINSLPPDESVAGQNATGCSQNTSHDISSMVRPLQKVDLLCILLTWWALVSLLFATCRLKI